MIQSYQIYKEVQPLITTDLIPNLPNFILFLINILFIPAKD